MSIKINAETKTDNGKGASRRLRKVGKIPAIVYGDNQDPAIIAVNFKDIDYLLTYNEDIYSSILALNIDGKEESVILKDLQRHPAKNIVTHADFQRVNMKSNITTSIPVKVVGLGNCKAVTVEKAVINQFLDTIEISCLPALLPTHIDVDISDLAIGEVIKLTDLKLADGIVISALNHGGDNVDDYDQSILSISAPTIVSNVDEDEVENKETESTEDKEAE